MVWLIVQGALIGLGATFLFDLWQGGLSLLPGHQPPNWAPIGRWFWHLRHGQVFHDDIAVADEFDYELALGWVGHYVVGLLYGIIFAVMAGPGWMELPTLLPALLFGLATVAFGWFLLQPGLGLGWAASKTPDPARVRMMNLAGHTVFGFGLWLTALAIG